METWRTGGRVARRARTDAFVPIPQRCPRREARSPEGKSRTPPEARSISFTSLLLKGVTGRTMLTWASYQKLQRKIANFRGVAPDAALTSPTQSNTDDARGDAHRPDAPRPENREALSAAPLITKRKYRRHPKVKAHFIQSYLHLAPKPGGKKVNNDDRAARRKCSRAAPFGLRAILQ